MMTMVLGLFLLIASPSPPQGQQQQLQDILDELKDISDLLREQKPTCSAQIGALNGVEHQVSTVGPGTVLLNLLGIVSRPEDACLPAAVQVTASFLDSSGAVICSGGVGAAQQNSFGQDVHLEIRILDLSAFVRWINEPPPRTSGPIRLRCMDIEGVLEVNATELQRADFVRIRVALLPRNGGAASTEIFVSILRPPAEN